MREPFFGLTLTQAREVVQGLGFSPSHADKLRRQLLNGELPELPGRRGEELLDVLRESFDWVSIQEVRNQSADDESCKFLFRLRDGEAVESVLLPGAKAPSLCLSTQVGCAMACKFCASGLHGAVRNLRAHELLEQLIYIRRNAPVRRLVFMGSGEPTQNLQELSAAIGVLREEGGIGPRRMLVSTVGPANAIHRLADLGFKVTLALSLHALDQELRGELIPTQKQVDPLELIEAADCFAQKTGRAYQVEYVLIGGVNDSKVQAQELALVLTGRRAHVSLIPWNAVEGVELQAPKQGVAQQFLKILRNAGISAVLRATVGGSANAACGQLRRQDLGSSECP
jgi:23S rRNA (adenine2503-C2)-methyltransferase